MIDINWNPAAKDLRGFGWVMLIGFGLIGLAKAFWPFGWGLIPDREMGLGIVCFALLVGIPAVLAWRVVVPVYRAWMGVAWVVGKVMFPLTFAGFYYLVVFPVGLVVRLVGKDALSLKKKKVESYWVPIEQVESEKDYERQY